MIGASTRPAIRMARRNLLRDRWRALLIVVLIGIPVFGMTAGALILQAVAPTVQERATALMGRADLIVYPEEGGDEALLRSVLPAGSVVELQAEVGDEVIVPGTTVRTRVWMLDPTGLAAGKVNVVEGRAPVAADEVALTRPLATQTDATIGDSMELAAHGTVRVVGIVETPESLNQALALMSDPGRLPAGSGIWLVGLPDGADPAEAALAVWQARPTGVDPDLSAALFSARTRDQAGQASEMWVTLVFVLGALALVEAALIASAAFAVGIRRRQRDLGLLGAAGATPRDMATVLLVEGATAGAVATLVGLVTGIAVALVIGPSLDGLTNRRVGGVGLDPLSLVVAAAIGMGAALIAAAVPAWGAARLPTLAALSGRRPPSTPARRLLTVGLALVAIAVAFTVGAPLLARGEDVTLPLALLVIGSIAGVLGFGACSPWLLERLDGPSRRLPLAPRIAVRDTSRARTRNGPIVTAVLASVAGMIALASLLASSTAYRAEQWVPPVPEDILVVQGDQAATLGARVAAALGSDASGPDRSVMVDGVAGVALVDLEGVPPADGSEAPSESVELIVGDESMLRALNGGSALAAFRDGAVVLFPFRPVVPADHATLQLVDADYEPTGVSFQVPIAVVDLPLESRQGMASGVIPIATAEALGLVADPAPSDYTVRLDHAVTQRDVDTAAALMPTDGSANVMAPVRPADDTIGFRTLLLVASLIVALSVTGVAVALGESEARADLRTLLTLGADRRLRRRVTAARGAVLAGLAGVLAVPAGLLPVWGVLLNTQWPIVIPLPEIIGALLVLPLMAIAGGLLLGRPLDERAPRTERIG